MEPKNCIKFKPEKDYDGLLKQAYALARIVKDTEKYSTYKSGVISRLSMELAKVGKNAIDAEANTNEQLTNHVLHLERKIEEITAAKSASEAMLNMEIQQLKDELAKVRTLISGYSELIERESK